MTKTRGALEFDALAWILYRLDCNGNGGLKKSPLVKGSFAMIDGEARNEGRITVFQLKDDLTADRVKSFLKRIYDLLDEGRYYLVIDLSQVYEISLLGMVGLSSIFNRCRQNGGALKVAGLTPAVRKAFRNTNLINTIEVYDEVPDGVKSFRSQNLLRTKHFSGSFFLKDKNAFVGWDRLPLSGHVH
jgi:anti-anti-sigma factor